MIEPSGAVFRVIIVAGVRTSFISIFTSLKSCNPVKILAVSSFILQIDLKSQNHT